MTLLSQSAVSSTTAHSFLKLITLFIAVHVFERQMDKQAMKDAVTWHKQTDEFMERFKLRKPILARVLADTLKGEDTEDIIDLAEALKAKRALLEKETDLSKAQLGLINNFVSIVLRDSETAKKQMTKNVSLLGDTTLSGMFNHTETNDQSALIKDLQVFSKKHFGVNSDSVTVEQKEALRAKNAEVYKQFLKLNRDIGAVVKSEILRLVRGSGAKLVHLKDVHRHMAKLNIKHKLPMFDGYLDEAGALYTSAKVKINGAVTGRIELNTKYDPVKDDTYVFLHYPLFGNGQPQRIYTINYKKSATVGKFDTVKELIDSLPKLQKRWRRDLSGDINSLDTVCAVIIETIYITSGRIGSATGATGISSLKVKEFLDKAANSFTLKYIGKKGIAQKHTIPSNTHITGLLRGLLRQLADGKNSGDFLMTYGPRQSRVTGSKVNDYLKRIGAPDGVTAHNFRHARGTILTKEILAKHPFGKGRNATDAAVNKWVLEALKKVGEKLGHMNGDKVTATTAIQNYIDPGLLKEFFRELGVRPNNAIQTAIDKASKDTE
jgi:integrase